MTDARQTNVPGSTAQRSRKRIGKYAVTGRIGRGGMGMVYCGWDELLEREVAIKTLTAEGSLDDESRQRFYIEARAAARLQHPNIVTVFELGEAGGLPFIAMEMLPGADLEKLLRSGEELLLHERLDIVIQVCRGLSYAHDFKIVHRDIKPSNVRLLDDGTAKIMDFGIAKLSGMNVTKSGMMVGTVHYMSPEQVRGRVLDGRSDVFSLGVILYELLGGRRPFAGPTATDVLSRIIRDPPAPIERDLGVFGPELQRILDGALAKEPEDRYPSAAALAEDLAHVAAGLPRSSSSVNPQETRDGISLARRLMKDGAYPEAVAKLEQLAAADPLSVDARRALRQARREASRRASPPPSDSEEFPELDGMTPTPTGVSTQRAPATMRNQQSTVVEPAATVHDRARTGTAAVRPTTATRMAEPVVDEYEPSDAAPHAESSGRGLLLVGAAAVALALAAGAVLWLRGREAQSAPAATLASGPPTDATVAPGPSQTTSPVEPAAAGTPAPVGPATPAATPSPAAEPDVPQGRVSVDAPYPVDVIWKGRTLARRSTSAQVQVAAGRQTLTLSAPSVFLRQNVTVDVRAGSSVSVSAAPLGKLNVRANPDNCKVFVNGAFVDYPPILDHDIVVGEHTVGFRWPDGSRSEQAVTITAGRPAFVTGRKD